MFPGFAAAVLVAKRYREQISRMDIVGVDPERFTEGSFGFGPFFHAHERASTRDMAVIVFRLDGDCLVGVGKRLFVFVNGMIDRGPQREKRSVHAVERERLADRGQRLGLIFRDM